MLNTLVNLSILSDLSTYLYRNLILFFIAFCLHHPPCLLLPTKAGVIVVPCAVRVAVAGIKLVGVPQPTSLHRVLPNFQGMFIPRGSRAD